MPQSMVLTSLMRSRTRSSRDTDELGDERRHASDQRRVLFERPPLEQVERDERRLHAGFCDRDAADRERISRQLVDLGADAVDGRRGDLGEQLRRATKQGGLEVGCDRGGEVDAQERHG